MGSSPVVVPSVAAVSLSLSLSLAHQENPIAYGCVAFVAPRPGTFTCFIHWIARACFA